MQRIRWIAVGVPGVALAAALLAASGCTSETSGEQAGETAGHQAAASANPLVVALTPEQIEEAGVRTRALRSGSRPVTVTAYGKVLSPTELRGDVHKYRQAHAALAGAKAQLVAAKAAYRRAKQLYPKKATSASARDQARAAMLSDQAQVQTAASALDTAETALRARWGGTIVQWVVQDAKQLHRLLQSGARVVELTLPGGERLQTAPQVAELRWADKTIASQFVSRSPATDTQLQGESFFYRVTSSPSAPPYGATLSARLSTGKVLTGVVVPSAAVVWWQGAAWVYLRKGEHRFRRRRIPADRSDAGDWFVPRGLKTGEAAVVRGAETLLSQQLVNAGGPARAGGGEEGDED